ncbi:YDG domain-containing protein [Hymenobacter chitinivorans]|uniref:Putative secreted protein (Por secretion system target) n=1 Tax=Hymenobacter chitinivorans DSM 11115 TaxID=1121954 RepID=A0A2M9B4P2_9BACT|nr:YDG domain-containing protein [Hymenobacter chitinivorans]PJJ52932.1 putative secreted protein (Por secretion system target) [Hymenobacter chitinivorans DSM 11115]
MTTPVPSILRRRRSSALGLLLTLILFLIALGGAAQSSYAPTVTSDKDDYAPGEVAHISGSGWTQDQTVHVEFKEEPDYPDYHRYDVPVAADGSWQIDYSIEQRHLGVKFTVLAAGGTTAYLASYQFTDAGEYPSGAALITTTAQSFCLNGTTTALQARVLTCGSGSKANIVYRWYYNLTNTTSLTNAVLVQATPTSGGGIWATNTNGGTYSYTPNSTVAGTRYYFCQITQLSALSGDPGCGNTAAPFSTATVAVTVTPPVSAPTLITVVAGSTEPNCPVTSATTTAYTSSAANSTGLSWSLNNSAAGTINASGVVTWAVGFVGTVNIEATAVGCNFSSASTTRTVTLRGPTVSVTGAATFCSGGSTMLTANATAGAGTITGYQWFRNGSAINGAPAQQQTYTASTAGTYTVLVTNSNTCTAMSAPLPVTVTQLPVLTVTAPAAVCAPATVSLTAAAVTSGSTLPSGSTLSYWTDAAATTPLSTPGAVAVSGTYYIKATNGNCSDIEPVAVTVTPAPTTANAGPAQTISGTSTTLAANTPIVGTGSWSITGGLDGVVATPDSPTSGFSGVAGTTYHLQWAIANGSCTSTSQVTITFSELPTTLTVAEATGVYGGTTTLTATLRAGSTPLSGKTIAFRLNNLAVGTATTDATGAAALPNVSLAGINASPTAYVGYVAASFSAGPGYAASSATGSLLVQKAPQTITWPNPDAIAYGTALSSSQLNAAVTGVAGGSAPGALSYTPAAGIILSTGPQQTLLVEAAATTNYQAASASVLLTVTQVTPDVTASGGTFPYDHQAHGGTGQATGAGTPAEVLTDVTLRYVGTGLTTYGPAAEAPVRAGTYAVTAVYAGSLNYTPATSEPAALTIQPKVLTASFTAAGKVYDATRAASITGRAVSGAIAGDEVSLTGGTATFADKTVGPGKTVTGLGFGLTGADAPNYRLLAGPVTATASITPKALTAAVTADSKTYDGTTAAILTTTNLAGIVDGDAVSISIGGAAFADKHVATSKTVTATDLTLTGADAANYSVNATAYTTADITPKALTIALSAQDKEYDGTSTAGTAALLAAGSGLLTGDVVTVTSSNGQFDSKTVGAGKQVTAAVAISGGADEHNYAANPTASATASITARSLVIGISAQGKQYDGTTAAAVSAAISSGLVPGDKVSVAATNGQFDDKNVGLSKPVMAGVSKSGADAGNYAANATATTAAAITAKALVASVTASAKVYDGQTGATVTGRTLSGQLPDDEVVPGGGTGSFANKHVGTGKTVTVTGLTLTGADAANYSVNATAFTTADITPKALTIALTAAHKVYDGTRTASVTPVLRPASGLVAGDVVTLGAANGLFATKNVGTDKLVTADVSLPGGADKDNYAPNTTASAQANITVRELKVTATAASKVFDGNTVTLATLQDDRVIGDQLLPVYTTASFADANVGTAKTVTVSGISIGGEDAPNYLANTSTTATANISTATSDLILSHSGPVQYSDQVTLTATVTSLSALSVLTAVGGTIDFKLGTTTLGSVAFPAPGGLSTVSKTFIISQKAGSYAITALFRPNTTNVGEATGATPTNLVVTPENTDVVYSGLEYFGTANSTSATANVEYIATLTDAADNSRGIIGNARAAFKEVNGLGETNLFGTTTFAVSPVSTANLQGTARTGVLPVTLSSADFGNGGRTFDLLVEAQGGYYAGRTPEHTLITIAVPGQDYVNGGGSVVVAQSGGSYAAPGGSKMNFGFTMKWNKSGKNIQGQATIIFRRLVGSLWRTYQIKSNSINTLGTVSSASGNQGDFNTKATLSDITDPLNTTGLSGGLDLSVQALESTVTGAPHKIGVTLRSSTGELLFSSNWTGGKTVLQELKGGKISVRSSTAITTTAPAPTTTTSVTLGSTPAKAAALLSNAAGLEIYPNPVVDQATIRFRPTLGGKAQVYLYNELGRLVATLYNAEVVGGQDYQLDLGRAELPNGVYTCRLITNSTVENRRFSIVK